MSTTLFTDFQGSSLPAATDAVRSSGYREIGKGAADYIRASSTLAASLPVSGQNKWWFAADDGSKFVLSPEQDLHFDMFGAYGDFDPQTGTGTDDLPQWQIASGYLIFFGRTGSHPFYRSLRPLKLGSRLYRFSNYIDLTEGSFTLIGPSRGAVIGGRGSAFIFDAAAESGIVVNAHNTAGVNGLRAEGVSGGGSTLINIHLASRGNGSGASTWKQDGFRIKALTTLIDCSASHWSRNNLRIVATSLSGHGETEGNASGCQILNCDFIGAGASNVFIAGGDVNVIRFDGGNCLYGGEFGIECNSFLGVKFQSVHCSTNGVQQGPGWMTTPRKVSVVAASNGHRYYVKRNQASNAGSFQPGVTSGWQNVWGYHSTGPAHALYPQWAATLNFVQGGPYRSINLNEHSFFDSCYSEGDQAPADLAQRTLLLGGLQGAGVVGEGFFGHVSQGQLVTANAITAANGPVTTSLGADPATGSIWVFRHETLAPLNYSWAFDVDELRLRYANSSEPNLIALRIGTPSSPYPHKLILDGLVLGFGNGRRTHSHSNGPPPASVGQNGDVCWNDQSNPAHVAVDYWYKKGGSWVARP